MLKPWLRWKVLVKLNVKKSERCPAKTCRLKSGESSTTLLGEEWRIQWGLAPGLVEKYTACAGCNKKRFELLKEFMLDHDMLIACTGLEILQQFVDSTCSVWFDSCTYLYYIHVLPQRRPGRMLKSKHISFSSVLSFFQLSINVSSRIQSNIF